MAYDNTNGVLAAPVSNPTTTLTDYPLTIVLTRDNAGSLFDAVTDQDATKFRFYKQDETTELAFAPLYEDWTSNDEKISFRVKWSGDLDTTTSYSILITPAVFGNTSYGVNDTYGRYAAFNSLYDSFYPSGGGADYTSNQNTLTAYGTASEGDTDSLIGLGTSYDGASAYAGSHVYNVSNDTYTIFALVTPGTNTTYQSVIATSDIDGLNGGDTTSANSMIYSDGEIFAQYYSVDGYSALTGTPLTSGESYFISVEFNNDGTYSYYVDGVLAYSGTSSNSFNTLNTLTFASLSWEGSYAVDNFFTGSISYSGVYAGSMSDEIAYTASQVLDNSTFWGTWTWTATATTISGITYDKSQEIEASVQVSLYSVTSGIADTLIETVTSDATTGAFSFTLADNTLDYLIVAYLDGSPDTFDVSANDIYAGDTVSLYLRSQADKTASTGTGGVINDGFNGGF